MMNFRADLPLHLGAMPEEARPSGTLIVLLDFVLSQSLRKYYD
jgi:hypothetical protein